MAKSVTGTTSKTKNNIQNPVRFIFNLFAPAKVNPIKDDHYAEIENAWHILQKNHTKLHETLEKLQLAEGGVISFKHLAAELKLPDLLVQDYFDTVCFTCIDERAQKNIHSALSIGIPGNFCLEKGSCLNFAKKIVLDCQTAGLTKIKLMPHAKCGAATLAVKKEFEALGWDSSNIPDVLIDKKAIDYAERMANQITEESDRMGYALDVQVDFIPAQDIAPHKFHNAVGSVVSVSSVNSLDLTKPHLDPKLFNEHVEPMFNISGFGNNDAILDRIILSIEIAFGGHGLGVNIFTNENPYLVLMVADSKEAVNRANKQLLPSLKEQLKNKFEELVIPYILDISEYK